MGESKSFVDSIWKKLKRDSQYQLEEVYDWASHLKYLKSILIEFDLLAAPTESTMVRYFEESLKPSIKAEMDQDASHLDDYKELVAKTVRAEAKAGLRPSSYIRETDQQVPQRNQPAYTTVHKVQTQGAMKNHCGEESKAKPSVPTSNQNSEPSYKAKKNKKKKQHKAKWDSTPATGVNKAGVGDHRTKKDISEILCYNFNKKGHYSKKCPESRKSKN